LNITKIQVTANAELSRPTQYDPNHLTELLEY